MRRRFQSQQPRELLAILRFGQIQSTEPSSSAAIFEELHYVCNAANFLPDKRIILCSTLHHVDDGGRDFLLRSLQR